MAQYSRGGLRDRVIANLQILEDALEGGLSNADVVEARAYQDTLRELRAVQTEYQGSVSRPDPSSQAPVVGLASSARTADTKSAALENIVGAVGVIAVVDVTATTTGTVASLKLYRVDPGGDVLVATATPAAAFGDSTGRFIVVFYPGGLDFTTPLKFEAANAAQFAMPRTYKVEVVTTDATSITYALDLLLIR